MGLLQQMSRPSVAPAQPVAPVAQNQAADKTQMLARVLAAAQKLMYSQQTRPYFLRLLKVKGDSLDIASTAAVKVILTIVDETKGQLDPSIIAPAGVAIVGDILDFLEKTKGEKFSQDQTHQAVRLFVTKLQTAIKNGGDSILTMGQ